MVGGIEESRNRRIDKAGRSLNLYMMVERWKRIHDKILLFLYCHDISRTTGDGMPSSSPDK